MSSELTLAIRVLTILTLSGLLFASGLRLTWGEILDALRVNRLALVLPVNFIFVPALAFGLIRVFDISSSTAIGILLLAASPFAPVVPTFARLARGDLALASALTGLFPILSAFLTPVVCELSLRPLVGASGLTFSPGSILLELVSTITLPLVAGVLMRQYASGLGCRLLKPIQVLSEGAGAVALIVAVVGQFQEIRSTGWKPLFAMLLLSELSFLSGWTIRQSTVGARIVVAIGTSNRNIALALLMAVASFPGSPVPSVVVANGMLLIVMGLLHVAFGRYLTQLPGR